MKKILHRVETSLKVISIHLKNILKKKEKKEDLEHKSDNQIIKTQHLLLVHYVIIFKRIIDREISIWYKHFDKNIDICLADKSIIIFG